MAHFSEVYKRREVLPTLLAGAGEDYSVDKVIEETVNSLASHAALDINPFQMYENMRDVAALLDRLLGYRREISAIQAERIKGGLAYLTAIAGADADAEVELARAEMVTEKLKTAVEKRTKATKEAISILESRHGEPGSPLHYTERVNRLQAQMLLDVESAYCRSLAISVGIKEFRYDIIREAGLINMPMPSPGKLVYVKFEGARFLDDWCVWHRRLSQKLETVQSAEHVAETSISLGMLFDEVYSPDNVRFERRRRALIPNLVENIKRADGPDVHQFDLAPNIHGGALAKWVDLGARLEALALTVSVVPTAARKWRFQAAIEAPRKGFVLVSNITTFDEGPRWVSGQSILNRPVEGKWTLSLKEIPLEDAGPDAIGRLDSQNWPITDLQLHLRLRQIRHGHGLPW